MKMMLMMGVFLDAMNRRMTTVAIGMKTSLTLTSPAVEAANLAASQRDGHR